MCYTMDRKVGYDVFDFEPFVIYIKRTAESRVDRGRTTDVLRRNYLLAIADQEYDSTWVELWADDAAKQVVDIALPNPYRYTYKTQVVRALVCAVL